MYGIDRRFLLTKSIMISVAMNGKKGLTTSSGPKHLVNMLQLSDKELESLVDKGLAYKKQVRSGEPTPKAALGKLAGKLVSMLFSKRSTRTRISTEGAAAYFGASPMFLGKDDIQLGKNESVYDTVRVLSSMTACIFARVDKHQDIVDLCKGSSVPIINSLCNRFHPLQAIADILTIKQAFGNTSNLKLAWVGDPNNVFNDLAIAALKSNISVSASVPASLPFDPEVLNAAREVAKEKNVTFEIVHEPLIAIKDANVIVTDTWVSMGQEGQKEQKLKMFEGYQITNDLIEKSKAAENWKFMHCLPRHPEEVDDSVFYSENSLVFEEAENRLYAAMAVIEAFVINKGDLLK